MSCFRSAMQQPRSSLESQLVLAAPTSAYRSKILERQPRLSMAGNYNGRLPTWTTWLHTRKLFQWEDMRGALGGARRVSFWPLDFALVWIHFCIGKRILDRLKEESFYVFCYRHLQILACLGSLMSREMVNTYPIYRQTIRRVTRPMASQICWISSGLAQKRRSQRGHQRSWHQHANRQAHPSQPGS